MNSAKKTSAQANFIFLERNEISSTQPWFLVECKQRQTTKHNVRQVNTKTTFFRQDK